MTEQLLVVVYDFDVHSAITSAQRYRSKGVLEMTGPLLVLRERWSTEHSRRTWFLIKGVTDDVSVHDAVEQAQRYRSKGVLGSSSSIRLGFTLHASSLNGIFGERGRRIMQADCSSFLRLVARSDSNVLVLEVCSHAHCCSCPSLRSPGTHTFPASLDPRQQLLPAHPRSRSPRAIFLIASFPLHPTLFAPSPAPSPPVTAPSAHGLLSTLSRVIPPFGSVPGSVVIVDVI